jgi:hypothetical protein
MNNLLAIRFLKVAGCRPALDFSLMNQDSNPVEVSRPRSQWVVLSFYLKDDPAGCACQAVEFAAFRQPKVISEGYAARVRPPGRNVVGRVTREAICRRVNQVALEGTTQARA